MSGLKLDCAFRYPTGFALAMQFTAEAGITALVGPSGSGKTTTLELIAGLRTPTRGRIELGDRVLFDSSTRVNLPPEQRRVGIVFQDYRLFPHLTVEQNLNYGLLRNPRSPFNLPQVVEILELAPFLRRSPHQLSGGQRQRIALGRALLRNPALLLLDEPLNALDDTLKANILLYLRRVLDEHPLPALFVAHDLTQVEAIIDRKVEMPKGTTW